MSRSNPTQTTSNPSTRWHEWNGENGAIKYYDKETKKNVQVTLPFTFIVLDQLYTIKGWHKSSESGITSNEVRSITDDTLTVKSFKGGQIATGLYKDIKEKVNGAGGDFHNSIYIAYKDGQEFKIGNLSLKGAGVNAWIEFTKKNQSKVDSMAVVLTGSKEETSGKVIFKVPIFQFKELSTSTQEVAVELDKQLQEFLTSYFGKAKDEHSDVNQESRKDENVNQEVGHMDDGKAWKPIEEESLIADDLDLPF